jgi:hypothetical protein
MSDLIKNLRDLAAFAHADVSVAAEAADEIERLRAAEARVKELEKALRKLITHTLDCEERLDEFHGLGDDAGSGMSSVVCEARSALSPAHKEPSHDNQR